MTHVVWDSFTHADRWGVRHLPALAITSIVIGLWNGFRQPPVQEYWSGELWLAQVAVGAQVGLGPAIVAFSLGYRLATSGAARRASE